MAAESPRPDVRGSAEPTADVCLIVEGAYPYVRGGVSSWTQDLIATQAHLRFHVAVIVAPGAEVELRYELPKNVSGLSHIAAAQLPRGASRLPGGEATLRELLEPVERILGDGDADALGELVRRVAPYRGLLGRELLLDSPAAWLAFNRLYERTCAGASYLNAFWAFRTLVAGLFSMVLADLPDAAVYHCVATGYAGLVAARAHYETGRPALVTEHGVYTNERRLEILSAPWLAVDDQRSLAVDGGGNKVKELWINTFVSYSKACYAACSHIITLFEGNFALQIEDGAIRERLEIIPNGIDLDRFGGIEAIPRAGYGGTRPPTIALVGRVVPIKDIKTYIRACALLRKRVPDVQCFVLGPMDEDPVYASECREMIAQFGLGDCLHFTGNVNLLEWFGKIDINVLTSVSEGQPLVMLEAGAAAVPSVGTDVGGVRELVEGRPSETPTLGLGGRVCPIGDPGAIAAACAELLLDEALRARCGAAMQARCRAHYDKRDLHRRYARLYGALLAGGAA